MDHGWINLPWNNWKSQRGQPSGDNDQAVEFSFSFFFSLAPFFERLPRWLHASKFLSCAIWRRELSLQTHSVNRRSYGVCGEVDAVEKAKKGQCIYVFFPKETTNLMKSLGAGELVVGKSEEQHQGEKDKGEEAAEFHTFNIKSLPKTKDGEASLMSLVDDIGGMGNVARCWILLGVMCGCKVKKTTSKNYCKVWKSKVFTLTMHPDAL